MGLGAHVVVLVELPCHERLVQLGSHIEEIIVPPYLGRGFRFRLRGLEHPLIICPDWDL